MSMHVCVFVYMCVDGEKEREWHTYQFQSQERVAAAVMSGFILVTDTDVTSISF